ncbi:MAG: S49 family peptidase, partial [Paludibacteraceae bacterium]|nr:S49 family peptidase [Paludibacteraceae bacterium]
MSILMGMMMGSLFSSSSKLEKNTVYQLKMKGLVVEQGEEDNPFASAFGEVPFAARKVEKVGLNDLCRNIRMAAEDERIKGIILRGGDLFIEPASAKTLRDELLNYKKSGKFLIAYSDRYDQLNYYIASAADKIFLNATGVVAWNGLTAQKMYYTRLLQKVGVEMQILKVGTFKSAVEPFFRTSMSEADKEQTKRYLDGIWSEMRQGVSTGRGIAEDTLD